MFSVLLLAHLWSTFCFPVGQRRSGEMASAGCLSMQLATPSFASRTLHHTLRTGGTVYCVCACVCVCFIWMWLQLMLCHLSHQRVRNRHRRLFNLSVLYLIWQQRLTNLQTALSFALTDLADCRSKSQTSFIYFLGKFSVGSLLRDVMFPIIHMVLIIGNCSVL